jgi:hypothetical protein
MFSFSSFPASCLSYLLFLSRLYFSFLLSFFLSHSVRISLDGKRSFERGVSPHFPLFQLQNYFILSTRVYPKISGRSHNEINTWWEATQRIMAAKLTRLTHKIAIQLHLVTESCTICSCRSKLPVRKLLDTPTYIGIGALQ